MTERQLTRVSKIKERVDNQVKDCELNLIMVKKLQNVTNDLLKETKKVIKSK